MALTATSFRNPLGNGFLIDSSTPNNGGYFNAQDFGVGNHLGEDWNRSIPNGNSNSDNGEPVYSIANGEVVRVSLPGDTTSGWGNSIVIKHTLSDGSVVYSQYNHLRTGSVSLSVGDTVTYGQAIGQIGNTGNSTAAHLHFEIKQFSTLGLGYSTNSTGYYDPSDFISQHRDIAGSVATTAVLEVGTSQKSAVEIAGDSDWFKVYLNAGQTYSFAARGGESGNGTLNDPMIRLRSPSEAILLTDNNGGGVRDARITGFTATQSGYYYVTAYSANGGTGSYTISAAVSTAVTDIAGSSSTTSLLPPGSSASSTIGSSGDQDWFRIILVAGQTYNFTQNAGSASNLDSFIRLLNSSGVQLAANDNFSGMNSQITFTATSSGTYYLSAQGLGSSTGSYTISASVGSGGTGGATTGADSISGSSANNNFDGLGGNDTILGNGGNDTILGGSGSDSLFGGTGDDSLSGGFDADKVYGDSGNDRILGGDGNDSLFGGSSNDAMRGDAGNDILYGGSGNDTLYGDAGRDAFVFNTALGSTNIDVIVGFSPVDDAIYLEDAVFTGLATGTLTSAAFVSNTSGVASDSLDRIIYETNTGRLYYDADGTGIVSTRVHFATVATNLAITQTDFLVY